MHRKFLLSWLAVFVVWMLGSFAVHGAWLGADYAAMPEMFRSEAESGAYMPYMLVGHILMAGAFVWIYQRGVEATPWMWQGIRFGLAIIFLAVVPTYLIYFAVQPMPANMVAKQILGDSILVLVLGVLVAGMNQRTAGASMAM